jgi:hypothetical protein
MSREFDLDVGEELRWEGRPAPRCYTFRNWRHSFFGLVLMPVCSYWQVSGVDFAKEYETLWLAWLPLPFLLLAIYLTIGHLFQARLEWNHVYYALTDRRLMVQDGLLTRHIESLELKDITYFIVLPYGEQLGTLQLYKGQEKRLTLHCIEHPRLLTDLLEETMNKRQSPNGDSPSQSFDSVTKGTDRLP